MKKEIRWFLSACLAVALIGAAGQAGATPTVDGAINDWLLSTNDLSLDSSGNEILWTAEHPGNSAFGPDFFVGQYHVEDNQTLTSGAAGGQNYDLEALYVSWDLDTETMYVAMITGFNVEGEDGMGNPNLPLYDVGDVVLYFDSYATAIRIDPDSSNNPPGYSYGSDPYNEDREYNDLGTGGGADGSFYSWSADVYNGVTTWESVWVPSFQSAADPYRAVDGSKVENGASVAYRNDPGSGDHNIVELSFTMNSAQVAFFQNGGTLGAHYTMECGNDHLDFSRTVKGSFPVPEPATMVLLGLGMAALVVRRQLRRS
jgi:hypothetical protein